jgi:guanylate kinase
MKPLNLHGIDSGKGITLEILEMIRTLPLIAIAGSSGAGKTELVRGMIERDSRNLCRVITSTSRSPRGSEVNGIDYHYYSRRDFSVGIAKGMFLEHDEYGSFYYGTGIVQLLEIWTAGQVPVLNLSLRGVSQLRQRIEMPQVIFVDVPELQTLRERILKRDPTIEHKRLMSRLDEAEFERSNWHGYCDVRIINKDGELDQVIENAMVIAGHYVNFKFVTKYTGST